MTDVQLLEGGPVVQALHRDIEIRVAGLREIGVTPCLATILVGDDQASATYVRMKANACKKLGLASRRIELPEDTSTDELLHTIHVLNEDPAIHGILLQHPVPPQIDERAAFDAIRTEKDVDGVTAAGFGMMSFDLPAHRSCTPAAILRMIDFYNIPLEGKRAVVIGRSAILGKPVSMMLLNRNATVTICHSKTVGLPCIVREADIIIAAVGKPKFVQGEWVKTGAVILDAGYNPGNVGDVDFEACLPKVSGITPVPGGVGPVTIATLLEHTVTAAERSQKR